MRHSAPRASIRAGAAEAVLVIGALALSLLLVEIGLRAYFQFVTVFDVEMWKYALMLKTAVPDARSHVQIPNTRARIMGAEIAVNSKGLRDVERPYEKPEGVYRLLVVGDSFTLGFGVTQEETFAKRLERAFNAAGGSRRVEVINSGVGNYNTVQELAFLKLEGYKYQPDHILLAFYLNDGEPTQKYEMNAVARNSIAFVFLKAFSNKLRAAFGRGMDYETYYRSLYEGSRWDAYAATLEAFVSECARRRAALTVLILPDLHRLDPYPFRDIHARVREFFVRRQVPVIDGLEAFPPEGDPRRFWAGRDDPHPNAEGHERIARLLLERLRLD